MHVFTCPCLNMQVHARGATPLLQDVTYPQFVKMIGTDSFFAPNTFVITLDLGGVTKEHFEENQFEQNRADNWKKLKQTAVPTLFNVPNPPQIIGPMRIKGVGRPKPGTLLHARTNDKQISEVYGHVYKVNRRN